MEWWFSWNSWVPKHWVQRDLWHHTIVWCLFGDKYKNLTRFRHASLFSDLTIEPLDFTKGMKQWKELRGLYMGLPHGDSLMGHPHRDYLTGTSWQWLLRQGDRQQTWMGPSWPTKIDPGWKGTVAWHIIILQCRAARPCQTEWQSQMKD